MATVTIIFERVGSVYAVGDAVKGVVMVETPKSMTVQSLTLQIEGQISARKSVRPSPFDSLQMKPVKFFDVIVPLLSVGKIPEGKTPIPFEIELPKESGLFESYHGMHINVQYTATADMKRGKLAKDVKESATFMVVCPGQGYDKASPNGVPIPFKLSKESMKKHARTAPFEISGQVDKSRMDVALPFSGYVSVFSSEQPIKSVELQLIRVEEMVNGTNSAREATEIQSIQVADGSVFRGTPEAPFKIPLWMVFPRAYTAASLLTTSYRVEFEVNLVIVFEDRFQVTQNFPLRLYRDPSRGADTGRAGP